METIAAERVAIVIGYLTGRLVAETECTTGRIRSKIVATGRVTWMSGLSDGGNCQPQDNSQHYQFAHLKLLSQIAAGNANWNDGFGGEGLIVTFLLSVKRRTRFHNFTRPFPPARLALEYVRVRFLFQCDAKPTRISIRIALARLGEH
jgi:hypothetical protein